MALSTYPMKQHGSRLWGRDKGLAVRAEIEGVFESLDRDDVLGLDLQGIEVMDFSFASEVVGKLLYRRPVEYPDHYMVLLAPSSYVKENLNAALKGLGLAVLVVQESDWEVIGKYGEADIVTLRELHEAKSTSTAAMAEQLGISITAVNNRLRKLADLGLVRRKRVVSPSGGEQYEYAWLV